MVNDEQKEIWSEVADLLAVAPCNRAAELRAPAESALGTRLADCYPDVYRAGKTIANYMWFEGATRKHVHVALRSALTSCIAIRTPHLDADECSQLAALRRDITRNMSVQTTLAEFLVEGRRLVSAILALARNPFVDLNLSTWFRILDEHLLVGHGEVSYGLQATISINRIKLLTALIEHEPSVGQAYLSRLGNLCAAGDWDFAV